MIQIVNKDYENMSPVVPKKKALAIFNFEDAKIVLRYAYIDFVIALKESNNTFAYCYNLKEVEEFYNKIDTTIIDKLRENPFNKVVPAFKTCPICNNELFSVSNNMLGVLDGNRVYHCEADRNHKFWKNSREMGDILHLNKNASETDFKSEQDFIFNNGKWIVYEEE